jgi:3-oxoadipate enol-lactonase
MRNTRPSNAAACAVVLSAALLLATAGCTLLIGSGASFSSDGFELQYSDVGSGEPLILLHGFAMSGTMQWSQLASALKPEYRLIVPDHRGHGASDKPSGAEHYGARMVDDVIALMDHLSIDRARVAGMSMGGLMTLDALARYPSRFRCGFVGAAGWLDPATVDPADGEAIAQAFERGEGIDVLNARLNPKAEKPGWLRMFFLELYFGGQDPNVLASVYRGMADFALPREVIEANSISTLVVIGDEDGFLPMAQSLEKVGPNYELEVLPGEDHGSIGSAPRFTSAMKEFFADAERCGADTPAPR